MKRAATQTQKDYGLEALTKIPSLYEVPKLRNLNFCYCTVCFLGRTYQGSWGEEGGGGKSNDYHHHHLRSWENTRGRSSWKSQLCIKSQSWEIWKVKKFWTDRQTDRPIDRHSDLYYPLVADKNPESLWSLNFCYCTMCFLGCLPNLCSRIRKQNPIRNMVINFFKYLLMEQILNTKHFNIDRITFFYFILKVGVSTWNPQIYQSTNYNLNDF